MCCLPSARGNAREVSDHAQQVFVKMLCLVSDRTAHKVFNVKDTRCFQHVIGEMYSHSNDAQRCVSCVMHVNSSLKIHMHTCSLMQHTSVRSNAIRDARQMYDKMP